MNIERALDRRFMGFRSILGFNFWRKAVMDIIKSRDASFADKVWCLRHGFTVSQLNVYGREELKANFKDYLSSKQYYQLHPINGMFSLWIDDKITVKHMLAPFSEHTPKYYFDIENGEAIRLPECPDTVKNDGYEGILELLRAEGILALKQVLGRFGIGFYRLEYIQGRYYITGKESTAKEIMDLLKSLNYYLVTEFVVNHETIRQIYPGSTNTIRLLIGKYNGEYVLLRAFMRFGNSSSHGVDNSYAGGLKAIIDEETGQVLFAVQTDAKGYATRISEHPDTGASFDILIPRWDEVVGKCMDICRSLPELRYLGFDVVITQDGFKIIEINSLSGLVAAQLKAPLLQDEKTRKVYEGFGLKV